MQSDFSQDKMIYMYFEYYRCGLYSITDFMCALALLYLFYTQGIAVEKAIIERKSTMEKKESIDAKKLVSNDRLHSNELTAANA